MLSSRVDVARYFGTRPVRRGMLLRAALALFGIAEAAWPRRTVDCWMRLAARGGRDVELRSWVYTAARLEGVLVLLWVLVWSEWERTRAP